MTFNRWTDSARQFRLHMAALLLCGSAASAMAHAQAFASATFHLHTTLQTESKTELDAQQAWEAKSRDEDPADLKGERVRPQDGANQLPEDRGRAGLEQALRRLGTRASLLLIVAHPDDEDGGMLTYESRGQGARVGVLTLTRGEGGQNVMSGDFDDALGLVRTRELLAADRYLGVDQMFGTEADFGFSKTIEEAFSKWTHERVLYDAVRAVRLYRPLVVASVFIGGITDGHGQHQVSGEITQEVFRAAADPKLFPEMGLPPWQVQKVYARVPFAPIDERGMYDYATGKYAPARFHNYVSDTWSTTPPHADVTVPEGDVDALLGGKSYVQFARQGLALQRSQIGSGMRVPSPGRFDVGYTRYGAASTVHLAAQEKSFFDGLDTSLAGVAGLAPALAGADATSLQSQLRRLDRDVRAAVSASSSGNGQAGRDSLADGIRDIDACVAQIRTLGGLPERQRYDLLHELRVKRVQFNDALLLWLGVSVQAEVAESSEASEVKYPRAAVPGQTVTIRVNVQNSADQNLHVRDDTGRIARFIDVQPRSPGVEQLAARAVHSGFLQAKVQVDAPFSRPYFTRKDSEQPFYDVSDQRLRNAPTSPPALTAWETVWYGGLPLTAGSAVVVRPQAGQVDAVEQLLMIVPAVSVAIDPKAGVIPDGQKTFQLRVGVAAESSGSSRGSVRLELPAGWSATPERAAFVARPGGKPEELAFTILPAQVGRGSYELKAFAEFGGKEYHEGVSPVGYPGLLRDNLYSPARYQARGVEVSVPPGLKVAYLPGTGDAVATLLAEVGITVTTVSVADIAAGRLAGYDAVLLGVRAYAARKTLPTVTSKLLEFAAAGGAVVVQYNSAEFDHNYGPFPYSLTGAAEKVVEEQAPVRLLDPAAQALRWPNRISADDFGGWVEERGHGFMSSWDQHFVALTEVHDPGQDPQRGGLLIAPVGKGVYVYCAYALYRQLPAGVPGAFRLMVNLVSLGRHPD